MPGRTMPSPPPVSPPAEGLQQARAILQRRDGEIHRTPDAPAPAGSRAGLKAGAAGRLLAYVADKACEADPRTASGRAARLRRQHPDATNDLICEMLIKAKCQQTALVGGASAAPAVIPGIGTLISLTVGTMVDIGSTIRAQAELVLEIAEVYRYPMDEASRREIVLLVTGLGAGAQQLAGKAGQRVGQRVAERYAQQGIARALPVIGITAAAGTNALATYIIGRRAQAYFSRGPESIGNWKDSLRAVSGVDERKIAGWLAETRTGLAEMGAGAGRAIRRGLRKAANRLHFRRREPDGPDPRSQGLLDNGAGAKEDPP